MICKSFEVMKSYIIILSVDCNTHLHTLSKKQKELWMLSLSAKTKGRRGRSLGGGKTQFFGKTEISGWWGGGRFQNLAGWEKLFCLDGIFNNFLFESKTKKLCNFKSWSIRNLWKTWLPPLWNESSHKENFYLAWLSRHAIPGTLKKWLKKIPTFVFKTLFTEFHMKSGDYTFLIPTNNKK